MFDLRVLGVKRRFACTCFSLIFCSLFNHTATFRRESDYPLSTHFIKDLKDWTETPAVSITEKNRSVTDTYASDVNNCPKNVVSTAAHWVSKSSAAGLDVTSPIKLVRIVRYRARFQVSSTDSD